MLSHSTQSQYLYKNDCAHTSYDKHHTYKPRHLPSLNTFTSTPNPAIQARTLPNISHSRAKVKHTTPLNTSNMSRQQPTNNSSAKTTQMATRQSTLSLFGGSTSSSSRPQPLFGGQVARRPSTLFGGSNSTTANTQPLFGGAVAGRPTVVFTRITSSRTPRHAPQPTGRPSTLFGGAISARPTVVFTRISPSQTQPQPPREMCSIFRYYVGVACYTLFSSNAWLLLLEETHKS